VTGLIFHLIAHTHWDREWYLPSAAFRVRLIDLLDDLILRLQADPEFRSFLLDGQTVLLEDYLRARPDREGEVRTLVRAGRLQIGPWYVLADELIPSGESLVRNLLLGLTDGERFGGRLEVLYSPDAFGHPAIWPTLAREFGIRYGVVWRGLGGEPDQARDLYRWRGPDGRDVLLWHLPPAGYGVGAELAMELEQLPAAWARVRDALVPRAAAKHVPVFLGADHHAAPVALPRLREMLAALEPDNAVRVSRLDEFFQAVSAGPAAAPPLAGELRWSYRYTWTLQGVHGTRAHLKRRNALAELWLERYAEPLAALARRAGGVDRRPALELAWRDLVRGQFHDTLAGCVSDEVAQVLERRLGAVEAAAREVVRASLFDLVRHDPDASRDTPGPARPRLVLWNPAVRTREGVMIADVTWFRRDVLIGPPGERRPRSEPGHRPFSFVRPDGRALPVQVLDRRVGHERLDARRHYPDADEVDVVRVAFRAPAVPGLGCVVLDRGPAAGLVGDEGVAVKGRSLINRDVEVTIQPNGALVVFDKRSREWFLDVLRLEDASDAGDTYSYCPAAGGRVVRAEGPVTVRRLAAGPFVAALEARFDLRAGTPPGDGRGTIGARLVATLHADSACVRCVLEIDNRATAHRLRARVPLNLPGALAVAGAPFGSVARPPVVIDPREFPAETPVATAPAHRFVAAAEGRRGLALLAPGFFEYEWTPQGELVFTLLRAVGELSRGDLPTRPGHAGWPQATPQAQCLGPHRVEVALLPLGAADLARGDAVLHAWEDAFLPLRGLWLRDARGLDPVPVDVTLEGEGLVLSAVKPARVGAGLVLRCYNATERRVGGAWRFGDGIRTAHRVRADERESQEQVLEQRGKIVRFVAEPHEIVTMLIT